MDVTNTLWNHLFPGVLRAKPYQITLYDYGVDWWDIDKSWLDVDEARNETQRHTLEEKGTEWCLIDDPIKSLAEENLHEQAQIFATAEAAGRKLLEDQFPEITVSKLLYCANTTLVFLAQDKKWGEVAIKLTGIEKECQSEMDAVLPILMTLGKNEHLVPLLCYHWLNAKNNRVVLVQWMPYLHQARLKAKPGTGLEALGLDLREIPHIQKIGEDIAISLKALHSKGLVHLDVKLDNLFFTEEDGVLTAYLGDYSSVKPVERQYEGKTSFTSDHAVPELRAGMPYSYGVDVYAWGQMMLRLYANFQASGLNLTAFVAGKYADSNNVQIVEEPNGKKVVSFDATDADTPFLPTVIRATNRDPKIRHADGNTLYTDLEARLTFDPSIFKDFLAYKAYRSDLPSADPDCHDRIEEVICSRAIGSGPYHEIDHLSLVRYRDGTCILCHESGGPMSGTFERHERFDDTISMEGYWKLVHYFSPKYADDFRKSVEQGWKDYIHCDYDSASRGFRNSLIKNAQNNVRRYIDINNFDITDWFTSCSDPYPPLIEHIGKKGIRCEKGTYGLDVEFEKRRIRIFLTEEFRSHRNCTVYHLLNWLDGVLHVFSVQETPATLCFFTPADWKHELTELIKYLTAVYPWLSVEKSVTPPSKVADRKITGSIPETTKPQAKQIDSSSKEHYSSKPGIPSQLWILVGILLVILFLAAQGNEDSSSKKASVPESSQSTYQLESATSQDVSIHLVEAKVNPLGHLDMKVDVTNLSEKSIRCIIGSATVTAGSDEFTGTLGILLSNDLEPGQTAQTTAMLIYGKDQPAPSVDNWTILKDPTFAFYVTLLR